MSQTSPLAQPDGPDTPARPRPKIGLALGSGAARGWAHVGAMRALDELGVEIDVYAGCSVGALVSAARLMGMWEEFLEWARSIGPIAAMNTFALSVARGGLIDPDKAFDHFKERDQQVEDLPKPWAAVATDLATGREVWLAHGSVLEACRASSAVPMVLQAARYSASGIEHWLIDGGASNPVPVNLARAMGADRIIAIDLNSKIMALSRFDRPTTRAVVAVEDETAEEQENPLAPVGRFIDHTRKDIERRFAMAKALAHAEPQLFETAFATIDIVQAQLAMARAYVDIADVRLLPDLSMASAVAFDMWETFEEEGYQTTMAAKEEILSLTSTAVVEAADGPGPAE